MTFIQLLLLLQDVYLIQPKLILPAGSFAFEVSLRKSVRISLIAMSGSCLEVTCTQGQIEAVPCEKAFVGLG